MADRFNQFARRCAEALGSAWVFVGALCVVLLWAISGPAFRFSGDWQLAINTGTTIITFLMVFVLQNSQNRDSAALNKKLDELLRAQDGARGGLVDLEHRPQHEVDEREQEFARVHAQQEHTRS